MEHLFANNVLFLIYQERLNDPVASRLKEINLSIAEKFGVEIIEQGSYPHSVCFTAHRTIIGFCKQSQVRVAQAFIPRIPGNRKSETSAKTEQRLVKIQRQRSKKNRSSKKSEEKP